MKNTLKYMIVALAGLSLLACNKKEEIVPQQEDKTPSAQEYTYTIAVAGDTKAYLDDDHMSWESGDKIGWFTDKAGNSKIDMSADPRTFNVSSTSAMSAGDYIYAYAPYKAGEQSKKSAPLSIPTAQDGVIRNAMPMVSLPIALTADMSAGTDTPAGQASFLSLGAVIEYNVYTTNAAYNSEKVESVTLTSSSNIAGNFTVNLTTVSESSIPAPSGLDQTSVTSTLAAATTVGAIKVAGVKVYQVVAPGTYSGTITVTTDAATYAYSITGIEFNRAKIKTFNIDLASANATRLTEKERILVGRKWKLVNYYESWSSDHITDGYNVVTEDYGGTLPSNLANPRLLFFANHAFSHENFGYYKDFNGISLSPVPADANGNWNLTSNENILHFSQGAFPIVIVSSTDLSSVDWTIVTLTEAQLHIYTWDDVAGQWANLVFEPDGENNNPMPWDHSFESGDFDLTEETVLSSDPITGILNGKSWTLYNDAGAYKICTPWKWAGTVIWNANELDVFPTVVTLSSPSFGGIISSVSLDFTLGANWEITANCSVGGSDFGSVNQHFTNTDGEHPKQTVTFTDSARGTIVITITQPANIGTPIMLRGIHVTYTPD